MKRIIFALLCTLVCASCVTQKDIDNIRLVETVVIDGTQIKSEERLAPGLDGVYELYTVDAHYLKVNGELRSYSGFTYPEQKLVAGDTVRIFEDGRGRLFYSAQSEEIAIASYAEGKFCLMRDLLSPIIILMGVVIGIFLILLIMHTSGEGKWGWFILFMALLLLMIFGFDVLYDFVQTLC